MMPAPAPGFPRAAVPGHPMVPCPPPHGGLSRARTGSLRGTGGDQPCLLPQSQGLTRPGSPENGGSMQAQKLPEPFRKAAVHKMCVQKPGSSEFEQLPRREDRSRVYSSNQNDGSSRRGLGLLPVSGGQSCQRRDAGAHSSIPSAQAHLNVMQAGYCL